MRQHDAPAVARAVLLYGEKQSKRVKGFAGIAEGIATIVAEHAEQQSDPTMKEGCVKQPWELLTKFQRIS